MLRSVVERLVSTLRRGDVLPPAAAPIPDDDRPERPGDDLTVRSSLRALTAATPGLREELVDRARTAGLLIGWVAVLVVPAWTLVDRIVVPEQEPPGFAAGELSLSLGVAGAAGSATEADELMSRADEQLYIAKVTRNSVGVRLGDAVLPG